MSYLDVGDRVRVVSEKLVTTTTNKIINGMTGTVKDNSGPHSIGVEFDDYVGGGKGRWGGKDGHCWYAEKECLEKIEETGEEMSEFKIGDRVEVISEPIDGKNLFGEMGKVVALGEDYDALFDETDLIGVEFDNNILGHDCCGDGKDGHCWWVEKKYLKKIEDTEEETKEEVKEETKADTLEQKILTALREEIGVEIGEEFGVYENGEKRWTCKFDKNGFFRVINDEFYKSGVWKDIIYDFCRYTFKRKPFVPQNGEKYWHFGIRNSLKGNKSLNVLENVWDGILFDYGMLVIGNVFRTKEEALNGKDKLLERLKKLISGG